MSIIDMKKSFRYLNHIWFGQHSVFSLSSVFTLRKLYFLMIKSPIFDCSICHSPGALCVWVMKSSYLTLLFIIDHHHHHYQPFTDQSEITETYILLHCIKRGIMTNIFSEKYYLPSLLILFKVLPKSQVCYICNLTIPSPYSPLQGLEENIHL